MARIARGGWRGEGAPVEFVLAGGVLLKQAGFARQVGARLRQLRPGARVRRLRRESVWGAIGLAKEHFGGVKPGQTPPARLARQPPRAIRAILRQRRRRVRQNFPRQQVPFCRRGKDRRRQRGDLRFLRVLRPVNQIVRFIQLQGAQNTFPQSGPSALAIHPAGHRPQSPQSDLITASPVAQDMPPPAEANRPALGPVAPPKTTRPRAAENQDLRCGFPPILSSAAASAVSKSSVA